MRSCGAWTWMALRSTRRGCWRNRVDSSSMASMWRRWSMASLTADSRVAPSVEPQVPTTCATLGPQWSRHGSRRSVVWKPCRRARWMSRSERNGRSPRRCGTLSWRLTRGSARRCWALSGRTTLQGCLTPASLRAVVTPVPSARRTLLGGGAARSRGPDAYGPRVPGRRHR